MSDHPVFWVGNRQPSITDTISSNGVGEDLSGKDVRFKAREVGSSTLLVDQPISSVPDITGAVRYDWSVADVTAPDGILSKARRAVLVWWSVTTAGKSQDVNEAQIEIRAHGPLSQAYAELEDFKGTTSLDATAFADQDIEDALIAASRAIEDPELTNRRFYLDANATQVRYYTAASDGRMPSGYRRGWGHWSGSGHEAVLPIDDLVELTELASDPTGDGSFGTVWTQGTDFVLEPRNAAADGRPYTAVRILARGAHRFPDGAYYPNSIRVTGRFGWATVPENVRMATKLIAARLLKLTREGAFGVAGFGADGAAVRISRQIPDMDLLLGRYRRRRLFV